MKIKQLIQGLSGLKVQGSKEIAVTGLSADSNTTAPGNLFIAKKGIKRDGAEFIPQAILAGAAAVVTRFYNPFLQITQILCDDPGTFEAKLAARFYRHPSKELWVAGITGTKGKTTTSYLIQYLLNHLDRPAGLIGTVETILGQKRLPSALTTQDAIRNQRYLSEMLSSGCKAAVLEVSSHGLKQGRVDEIEFALALFTNLTPDHLDYHETIGEYASEKKKLFDRTAVRIFNADSPWTPFMKGGGDGMTFGLHQEADVSASEIQLSSEGTTFTVSYANQKERFSTPLMGRFNLSNLLGAISVGLYLGASLSTLSSIFAQAPSIPGRLEQIENDRGIRIFVDFAHSGEALENVLSTLREITSKRLIVVFGCGGGRDSARRSGMAAAAEKWADLAIITSDNPRHEEPMAICKEIIAFFQHPEKAILEVDRTQAIRLSIELAKPGDLLLIAGKGHEKTQIFKTQTIPYDDCLIAKEELLKIQRRCAILS